ncbi:MAG: ATP-binding protein [Pseudomonadota bacterium]
MTTSIRRNHELAHDVASLTPGLLTAVDRLRHGQGGGVADEAGFIASLSSRIDDLCRAELKPVRATRTHTGECIGKLLAEIDAFVAPERKSFDDPFAIRFQIVGEIDFDCCGPVLFRVLHNLINNAASALAGRPGARIDVLATQHAGRLVLQVADNGPGLPKETEAWFATSRLRQFLNGARIGMGLSTVCALLAREDGEIRLLDTGPDGTRFGLSLPVRRAADGFAGMFGAMKAEVGWAHPLNSSDRPG